MANRIQIRRDSENNWNNIDPILADGELALTYDNNKIKVGDGNQNWSALSYIVPSLSTVATSGDYNDLSGKPTVPSTLQELISYSAGNNKQFLRFNSGTSAIEFANDFRVVPYSGVVYPGGTLGSDVSGDIAFDDSGIYYCYQTPNSYSVNYSGSTGWVPAGWIKLDSRGPGSGPQVGDKLTDGIYTSTVASIEASWTGTLMLINISPAISSWKNGSGSLTVYTGTEPHLNCWARASWFSGSYNDLDDKPTIHPAEPAFSVQTTNFNASVGTRYGVNTTLGTITATLPASPATGSAIYFVDAGGAFVSNNLIIARNGQTIMGSASNMTVNTNDQSFGLMYNGTTWRVY